MTPLSVTSWHHSDLVAELLSLLQFRIGDFVLVGAYARDIVCTGLAGLERSMPRTHDIDIAIGVARDGDYESLVSQLEGHRFRSRMRFCLSEHPEVPIDVIPYGPGVADPENISLDADRALDATGMAEAAACALPVAVNPSVVLRVPPLHALLALKFIAYGLRIEFGDQKDARDADLLLDATCRGPVGEEDCFAHADVAPTRYDFDQEMIGPWLAGVRLRRDMGEVVTQRVLAVLEDERLPGVMTRATDRRLSAPTSAERRGHLAAFADGLTTVGHIDLQSWPPAV